MRFSLARLYRIALAGSTALLVLSALWTPISGLAQARREVDPGRARALQLLNESSVAYREGRFGEAATMLQEAYALHAEPILLYNLARALEADGQLDEAAAAYRQFLEVAPEAEQAAPSRRRVEVIEGLIAARDAPVVVEPVVVEEAPVIVAAPPPSAGPDTTAPWVMFAASTAIAGAGAILLGVSVVRYADAERASMIDYAAIESEAFALRDAGAVLLGIGAAAMVGTGIWAIVASTSSGPSESVALRVSPFGLQLDGTF
jgi:tetratricopeptide (TPR) repeat protein